MNIDKFQFWQIFNDGTGKTSVTKVTGFLTCMVSLGAFASSGFIVQRAAIFKVLVPGDIMNFLNMYVAMAFTMFGAGAALLGIDRIKNEKPVSEEIKTEEGVK